MVNVWTSAGLWFGFYCFLALVAWGLGGPIWGFSVLCLLLIATLVRQLRQLSRFLAWAREPAGTQPPETRGIWEVLFATLTRRVRAANSLREELTLRLERFREAGEAMPDGVVTVGPGHIIDWFNSAAGRYFSLRRGTDEGAPLTNLVRHPRLVAYLEAEDFAEPLVLLPLRQSDPILSVQVIAFGAGQKLILARDITHLEKLEHMRSDFVANVSHELKTPLTVVSGFIETLLDFGGELPPEDARSYLQMALDQSVRMQRLVDDLLTLAALETDAPSANEEKLGVAGLMAEVGREAEALSGGRHHILLAPGEPVRLLGCARELHSALANLASNAVRYTPEGGHVRLAWSLLPGGDLEVAVSDDGIGIAREHVPRLTERFYRVDRGRSRESGGTGLGLAIVKHVLTRHQGELRVDSEPGRGSCFTARFPVSRVLPAE
ncbi:MAG: phosphate regulon sensor histidine kinase PhoR [Rhodocyclaceae bacterium]|nr:phosphate regulon sensor histidine kinase PhoR [Rhodocyclaceae bacterium]